MREWAHKHFESGWLFCLLMIHYFYWVFSIGSVICVESCDLLGFFYFLGYKIIVQDFYMF
jgi:hypothetical protein